MKDDFKNEYDTMDLSQLSALSKLPNNQGSGMKYDGGKQLANILFQDFPNALTAVIEIATFGARKYARNSWLTVPDAHTRYSDALVRHQLAMGRGEVYDDESDLLHAAHFAWNALATLELLLRQGTKVKNPSQQATAGEAYTNTGIELGIPSDRTTFHDPEIH